MAIEKVWYLRQKTTFLSFWQDCMWCGWTFPFFCLFRWYYYYSFYRCRRCCCWFYYYTHLVMRMTFLQAKFCVLLLFVKSTSREKVREIIVSYANSISVISLYSFGDVWIIFDYFAIEKSKMIRFFLVTLFCSVADAGIHNLSISKTIFSLLFTNSSAQCSWYRLKTLIALDFVELSSSFSRSEQG